MAKAKQPSPGSVTRAKSIREQIDQLRKKRSEAEPTSNEPSRVETESMRPRSLRDVIHERMGKFEREKKN